MNRPDLSLGIIGGSGFYRMEGLRLLGEERIQTPWGEPSDPIRLGELDGIPIAFLARHGEGHRILPSDLNYHANIWALKSLGVQKIISVTAVGSLQPRHHPGELRVVRQFIDLTKHRRFTFFGEGLVAHVGFAEPTCPLLSQILLETGQELALPIEDGATYVCMEGPAFSTRAESLLHQSWGADLIGMTLATEAKLAREAEIGFAGLALVTDYDAWHEEEAAVDVATVIAVLQANVTKAERILARALPRLAQAPNTACNALATALMTQPQSVPAATREKLSLLVQKYGY